MRKQKKDWAIVNNMSYYSCLSQKVSNALISNFHHNTNDIRLTFFGRITNICDVRKTNLIMIEETYHKHITKKKYREKIFKDSNLPLSKAKNLIKDSIQDVKRGLFLDIYQATESAIKLLARDRNVEVPNNFGQTFTNLVNLTTNTHSDPNINISNTEKNMYTDLQKLMSVIRNCIHNNGIYRPVNQRNFHMVYKGITYSYRVGDIVPLKWSLIFIILEDVINMLNKVINNINHLNLFSNNIVDPTV